MSNTPKSADGFTITDNKPNKVDNPKSTVMGNNTTEIIL